MRTQDLNRFELLARALSRGQELDPREVEDVLAATRRTREELERRAEFHRGRQQPPPPPGPLEQYQEETKIMGMPEGMFVVTIPMIVVILVFLLIAMVIVGLWR